MTNDNPFPAGAPLVAYVRDSGGPTQEHSTSQQEQAIVAWANAHGYKVIRVFKDQAKSGTTTAGRDEFTALQDYLNQGPEVAGVVFWDYSRWARNYDDAMYFMSSLRRSGYKVHSLEDEIPEGPVGRMIEAYYATSAAQYSEKLSRAVKRGQHDAARRGSMPQGNIPIGYEAYNDGDLRKLRPDPIKAPLVQRAFAMRAEGYTMREIHERVGLFTTYRGYAYLLRNQIYIGRLSHGDVTYPDFCEPLIDIDTWRQVQTINQRNAEAIHPRQVTSSYLLAGIASCSLCGNNLAGATYVREDRRYCYYRCTHLTSDKIDDAKCPAPLMRQDALDGLVMSKLKELLLDPPALRKIYDLYRQEIGKAGQEYERERERQRLELADVRRKIDNTARAIAEGGQMRALVTQLADLEHREAELLSAAALELSSAPPSLPDLDDEGLERFGAATWQALEEADHREQQRAIRGLVKSVRATRIGRKITGEMVVDVFGESVVSLE